MKKCIECGTYKDLDCFHNNCKSLDGKAGCCKICANKRFKEYSKTDHYIKIRKEYYEKIRLTDKYKANVKRKTLIYRKKYPEKRIAHYMIYNHVKSGKIKRLPCEICGDINSQAHHPDYSKPLDVVWLCVKHHVEESIKLNNLFYEKTNLQKTKARQQNSKGK
jgi:hypothetical protein